MAQESSSARPSPNRSERVPLPPHSSLLPIAFSFGTTHPHGSSTTKASSCPLSIVSSILAAASAPDAFAPSTIGPNLLVIAPNFFCGYRSCPSSSMAIGQHPR